MTKLKPITSTILLCLLGTALFAQQIIHLSNPSFEDMPRHSKQPQGWFDCGDYNESPPDVQPHGGFGVTKMAHEGNTYVAMVVRDNGTTEAIGQNLPQPLEANKCYDFSVFLSQSEYYVSISRRTEKEVNHITPAKVRIWGGDSFCGTKEFLGETALIDHQDWTEYIFNFSPTEDINYLLVETFYKEPTLFPYNGNVLIDHASPIVEVSCDAAASEISTDLQDFYKEKIGTIRLENGSFEIENINQTMAEYWHTCDDTDDLVTLEPANTPHQMPPPQDGINYISLAVDDNTLVGALNKNLSPYLQPNNCYLFSLQAAHADYFLRKSPFIKKEKTNFDASAKIQIWGGNKTCEKEDLLAETPLITHQDWKSYEFIIQPKRLYSHFRIEAAYESPVQFFYNGNVLLDALSDIQLFNCDSLEYYYENIQQPSPLPTKSIDLTTTSFKWENDLEKPKDKSKKSYTYSVRDSEESINENLLSLLSKTYPNHILIFNIFAPTKEDGEFQENLLIKELNRLKYPPHWYKTKTYLED